MQTLLNLNKIGAKIKNHNFIELYKQNEKKKSRIIQNFDSLKTNSLPMFVYTHPKKKKKLQNFNFLNSIENAWQTKANSDININYPNYTLSDL